MRDIATRPMLADRRPRSALERAADREARRIVRPDSPEYAEIMREARALMQVVCHIRNDEVEEELDLTRRTWDGRFVYRADGSPRSHRRAS